ncbi:MAG: threonylcarbamoyl-AMP synthase [Cyanobacteria bacterium M5B4]|nr:MAG: threonylcarbamoyl-AMP synthase [Cyanobacteria bacterium M5B4]
MATVFSIHPQNPQTRTIEQIVERLRAGAVMLYPTDTVYGIGCDLQSKAAIEKVRQIKQLSSDKPLTFLCSSLSNISLYAVVNDNNYRLMKSLIPGAYTFILPTTKLVPKIVMNPKRKTTGIRVPDHLLCQKLLQSLGNPIVSTSANWQKDEVYPSYLTKPELFDYFDKIVDLIIDDDSDLQYETSSILDLSGEKPIVVRAGLGDVSFLV